MSSVVYSLESIEMTTAHRKPTIRSAALLAATAALALCAAPAAQAAKYHPCGPAHLMVKNSLGYGDFAVKGTTCRTVLEVMRAYFRYEQTGQGGHRNGKGGWTVQGWTIEKPEEGFYRGSRGRARFYCEEDPE
jgi:hypothetical protein